MFWQATRFFRSGYFVVLFFMSWSAMTWYVHDPRSITNIRDLVINGWQAAERVSGKGSPIMQKVYDYYQDKQNIRGILHEMVIRIKRNIWNLYRVMESQFILLSKCLLVLLLVFLIVFNIKGVNLQHRGKKEVAFFVSWRRLRRMIRWPRGKDRAENDQTEMSCRIQSVLHII